MDVVDDDFSTDGDMDFGRPSRTHPDELEDFYDPELDPSQARGRYIAYNDWLGPGGLDVTVENGDEADSMERSDDIDDLQRWRSEVPEHRGAGNTRGRPLTIKSHRAASVASSRNTATTSSTRVSSLGVSQVKKARSRSTTTDSVSDAAFSQDPLSAISSRQLSRSSSLSGQQFSRGQTPDSPRNVLISSLKEENHRLKRECRSIKMNYTELQGAHGQLQ